MKRSFFTSSAVVLALSFSTPATGQDSSSVSNPSGNSVARELDPEMQAVINKLASYNGKPLMQLTIGQARVNPSPGFAARNLMIEAGVSEPLSAVDTSGRNIQVPKGSVRLRIYAPKNAQEILPAIVYYHGGGWVIGSVDSYDDTAAALAAQAGAVVVSVAYRQAPEHKFPVAHNDSYAAYKWVIKHAKKLRIDADRVAVAGESAGGNLAAAVSMMARDEGFQMPVHQLLIYPVAGYDFQTASYQEHATAKPLDRATMQWFFDMYLKTAEDGRSPWISLVHADLNSLPVTTIIRAQIDPLHSEGSMLEQKLLAAGVAVAARDFDGVTHEFFGMAPFVPDAVQAQLFAAARLKEAFKK